MGVTIAGAVRPRPDEAEFVIDLLPAPKPIPMPIPEPRAELALDVADSCVRAHVCVCGMCVCGRGGHGGQTEGG